MNCSQCNQPLSGTEKFCPACGRATQAACGGCGAPLNPGANFCSRCGARSSISSALGSAPPPGNPFFSGPGFGPPPGPGGPVTIGAGETLLDGRFAVQQLLGSGGFGSVYQVLDHELGTTMALKVVFAQLGQAQSAVDQLKFEFKARDRISDVRHILKAQLPLTDRYKGLELVLLPMEHAASGSLRQWLAAHPVTPGMDAEARAGRAAQALDYFRQACAGVRAVHAAGLVHLDLKPENLLLDGDGTVKVADFGLARNTVQMSMAAPELLRDGVGTPPYMAPEQIRAARAKDVDHLADIYALGCILFELLDGDPPYDGTRREILEKHKDGLRPKLEGVDPVPTAVVYRCLSTDPAARFADIPALLDALDGKTPVQAAPEPPPAEAPPPKPRIRLRSEPQTVEEDDEARRLFSLNSEMKPLYYTDNQFEDHGDGTVSDHVNGLMWHRKGSENEMGFPDAARYIDQLNRNRFAGHDDWRLPTVDELCSLLTPHEQGELYIDPIFDDKGWWCWSADLRSSGSAWGVGFHLGVVHWGGRDCDGYVRAVRTRQ